jgi:DNA ligase D-like protein (predicted ligase)
MFTPLPLIKPMLATAAQPFSHPDYLYEVKWDGYRALLYLTSSETKIYSRNLKPLTNTFPELVNLHQQINKKSLVLDGEIIILDQGKPSFNKLQARGRLKEQMKINQAVKMNPALYMAFDVLYLAGQSVMKQTLLERKALLEKVINEGKYILISRHIIGAGDEFYNACVAQGLEGVVAKQMQSPYLPGSRSVYWKKIRYIKSAELVICGYDLGQRSDVFGSLILGGNTPKGLVYQGKVGTGFSRQEKQYLVTQLNALVTNTPALMVPKTEVRDPIWVIPSLACEIHYTEITPEGRLRHGSYKGLRPDKDPQECWALGIF